MIWINLKKEQKNLRKNRTYPRNMWHCWYDWLLNSIPELIAKLSLFKTKDYSKPKRVKTVCGGGKNPNKLKI